MNKTNIKNFILIILVLLGLGFLLLSAAGSNSNGIISNINKNVTKIPSRIEDKLKDAKNKNVYLRTYPQSALTDLWVTYKEKYVQNDGRTVDKGNNLITTSEGQSYTMLQAIMVNDKETFDNAWKWTQSNLQLREDDRLFAWKWAEKEDGSWGITDPNTASDADQDIALALILAYYRWDNPDHLAEARLILNDIWETEVSIVNDIPYVTAGNWADEGNTLTLNPSYFTFYSYPAFARVDPLHPWEKVKDSSYDVIEKLISNNKLPPDWVELNKTTGELTPISFNDQDLPAFSHDAIRVPYRVAADWVFYKDPRAKAYLDKLDALETEWEVRKTLVDSYALDGTPRSNSENLAVYGSLLPFFSIVDKTAANEILDQKIGVLFNPDTGDFRKELGYYSSNLAWFGLALYKEVLNEQ
jgi:endoglucanase